MAFRDYKSVGRVLADFPLDLDTARLFPDARLEVPPSLLDDLRFSLDRRQPEESEAFYTENFVAPFLKLVWRRHPRLHVWSHRPFGVGDKLTGEPDYLVSENASGKLTNRLLRTPLVAVAEAKRQDFDEGWGQCLAVMLACQADNGDRPLAVYGVVSTGLQWEFGRLDGQRFTRHPDNYGITDPALVAGMLDQLFAACEQQLPA